MQPGPVSAFNVIERHVEIESAPRSGKEILHEIIIAEGWFTGEEAQEKTERWARKFLDRARKFLNKAIEDGDFQPFGFNSRNSDYIQGSCFLEPDDGEEIMSAKRKRANTLKLYRAISNRTADDLELLCVKLLTLLGVTNPSGTPRSGDGGVDFYGYSNFGFILRPEILPAGAEKHMRVWFVGQAKHYDASQVSTKDIREIVGSVSLARAKLYAGRNDPLESFTARLCEPVFSMFVTTGRFSKDSKDLMRRSGIIPMDGPQLGQFLADNNVGLKNERFEQNVFDEWINSNWE